MTKPVAFSPYHHAVKLGATNHDSGINWSYADFPNKATAVQFEKDCNDNGYRTRNLHSKGDCWIIQYHHYQD